MSDEREDANPQMHEGGDGAAEENMALDTGRPAVAAAPAKVMLFVLVGLVCVGIVVKSLFFSDAPVQETGKPVKGKEKVVAGGKGGGGDIAPGELPTPPHEEPITTYKGEAPTGAGDSSTSKLPDLSKLPPPPNMQAQPNVTLGNVPPVTMGNPAVSPTIPVITAPNLAPSNTPPVVAPPPLLNVGAPPLPTGRGSAGGNASSGTEIGGAPVTESGGGAVSKAPPPPPPGFSAPPVPNVKTALPKDEKTMKRIQSESTISSGGEIKQDTKQVKTPTGFVGGTDSNSQFANSVTAAPHNQSTEADRILHLEYTLIQGKIIYGVLETAIDSSLPGTLRAVVSHDVYAEAGRAILIPKGSRLIGTYNTAVKRGQGRVFIIWTRVIRPDGVTIDVDSPAVDNLGRSGLFGDVDNHYTEMFSTALFTSSLDIGLAALGEGLFGSSQQTTTTNGSGGTTSTSSPTATAMQQAVSDVGNVGKQIVSAVTGLTPTITVDQGTPVNIFVNKELVFPPSVTGGLSFVQ